MKSVRILSAFLSLTILLSSVSAFAASDTPSKITMFSIRNGAFSTVLTDENGNSPSFSAEKSGEKRHLLKSDNLPSKYDSRDPGIIPPVKNQRSTAACWAFAGISALETDAVKRGLKTVENADFSEAHLVHFTFSSPSDKSDSLCGEGYTSSDPLNEGGSWARFTGTLSEWSGAANEADYPLSFDDSGNPESDNIPESARYDRSSGIILGGTEVLTAENDIKNSIIDHGSCTATFNWNPVYENTETSAYYFFGNTNSVNHMITIVGWDDEYSASNFKTEPEADGAWIVRDSRGENAHNGGYFMLSYYDKSLTSFVCLTARSAEDFDRNYTYNGVGFGPCLQHSGGAETANIFSTVGKEKLTAVSLYTVSKNTSVRLRVFTGIPENAQDPTLGTCIAEKTVTFKNQGYYIVELDSPPILEPGTEFAVVLTYSCADSKVLIPAEYKNGYSADNMSFRSTRGQSFCRFADYNDFWLDSAEYDLGNFYIQAFTECEEHTEKSAETVKEPTCTEAGEKNCVCAVCGETYTEKLDPRGHSFTDYIYNNDALPGEDGTETAVCDRCDETDTRTAPGTALPEPTVEITGADEIFDYRSTVILKAGFPSDMQPQWHCNAPDWHIDQDGNCVIEEPKDDFEVYCSVTGSDGKIITSETRTVRVRHGFFDKVVWFFRSLFQKIADLFR